MKIQKVTVENNQNERCPRYVRIRQLEEMLQWSVSTIWRKSKDGSFVKPVKLSERITAWPANEVNAWLKSKEDAAK